MIEFLLLIFIAIIAPIFLLISLLPLGIAFILMNLVRFLILKAIILGIGFYLTIKLGNLMGMILFVG